MKRYLLFVCVMYGVLLCAGTASADYRDTLNSIKSSFENDPNLDAHAVDIYFRQGRVILKGEVASEKDRQRMIEIAEGTPRVISVTDWLFVTPKFENESPMARYRVPEAPTDSDLAAAVHAAISADSKALGKQVSVTVSEGTAAIKGMANSYREVDQALATALMVPGISDVSNHMTIKGRIYNPSVFKR